MSDLPEAMLVFFLVPVVLYVVPTLIARGLIQPERGWPSDAALLFLFFVAWYVSLRIRQTGMGNWVFEPGLLAAAPVIFWLLCTHRLVTRPKAGLRAMGQNFLLVVIAAGVLLLFPLLPVIGDWP